MSEESKRVLQEPYKLEWAKPMTSREACKYHLTAGLSPIEIARRLKRQAEQLARQVEALEAGREWRPIETAPQDGSEFLTLNMNQGGVVSLVCWNKIHNYWQSKGTPVSLHCTHWMPIPEPPK